MPKLPVTCIARGHEGHWEAICLDFNIAAQGESFQEVERLLFEAVTSYVEDALKEDEPTRTQLLSRQAPLSVRLSWFGGLLWAALCGRIDHHDGDASSATVPFAVPCPA